MPIINLKQSRVSGPQLKYLEYLVSRVIVGNPTFKISRMPKIVGRPVVFISDLTNKEASLLIDVLK